MKCNKLYQEGRKKTRQSGELKSWFEIWQRCINPTKHNQQFLVNSLPTCQSWWLFTCNSCTRWNLNKMTMHLSWLERHTGKRFLPLYLIINSEKHNIERLIIRYRNNVIQSSFVHNNTWIILNTELYMNNW